MLRRVAEHLFWAARYLERAQWRARLVDVNYHLLLEVPPRDTEPWEPLLAITAETDEFGAKFSHADETSVVQFFTFDPGNPSSIRGCIESARANLNSLRHLISSELWLEINRLYLDNRAWSPDSLAAVGVAAFFGELRDRFHAIAGIIDSTMPRDLEYDFMEVGTMVERSDSISRLLDVKYHFLLPRIEDVGGAADMRQWMAVLRSASALEAFRKTYGNAMKVDRVVDMLVFNPSFPRSLCFCVNQLAMALDGIAARQLDQHNGASLCDGLLSLIHKGSAKAVIDSGLHEFLLKVQQECAGVCAKVFDRYMTLE